MGMILCGKHRMNQRGRGALSFCAGDTDGLKCMMFQKQMGLLGNIGAVHAARNDNAGGFQDHVIGRKIRIVLQEHPGISKGCGTFRQ